MTYEMMIAAIKALNGDAFYFSYDNTLRVILDDLEGFENEDAVETFIAMPESEAVSVEDDEVCEIYHFADYNTCLSYVSSDD